MVDRFKFASAWNGGSRFAEGQTYVCASDYDAAEARIRELEAERASLHERVREWAAYCRVPMNCPNIADSMESAIGDPPHDYTSDRGSEHG